MISSDGGFDSGDAKQAFLAGMVETDVELQPGLLALLTADAGPAHVDGLAALRIVKATRTHRRFMTDRGMQSLPAWDLELTHSRGAWTVLSTTVYTWWPPTWESTRFRETLHPQSSIDPSGLQFRYSSLGSSGRGVTHRVGEVLQTDRAVHVTVESSWDEQQSGALSMALATRTVEVALDRPLGAGLLIDQHGNPMPVVADVGHPRMTSIDTTVIRPESAQAAKFVTEAVRVACHTIAGPDAGRPPGTDGWPSVRPTEPKPGRPCSSWISTGAAHDRVGDRRRSPGVPARAAPHLQQRGQVLAIREVGTRCDGRALDRLQLRLPIRSDSGATYRAVLPSSICQEVIAVVERGVMTYDENPSPDDPRGRFMFALDRAHHEAPATVEYASVDCVLAVIPAGGVDSVLVGDPSEPHNSWADTKEVRSLDALATMAEKVKK